MGIDIEVISAEQEALLAFFSVQRAFDLTDKHAAVADIGGGSTEIVLAYGNLVEAIYTTQLGAVRLSEMFGNGPGMAGDDFLKMVDYIDRHLRKHTKNPVFIPHMLFGSGGTFTSLASMVMAGKHQSNQPVRGYQVTRAEVRHLLERLRKLPLRDRSAIAGLEPRPGRHHRRRPGDRRSRDGSPAGQPAASPQPRRARRIVADDDRPVARAAQRRRPGRSRSGDRTPLASAGGELEHGRHVAQMAGLIFSQLIDVFELEPPDQALLETAARLQDVGYLINYEQHHKHSYQLDPQQPAGRLSARRVGADRQRGPLPPRRQSETKTRQLSPPSSAAIRSRVRQLAAILRVAGGLDRSHTQQVRGLTVTNQGGTTEIRVQATHYPDLDIWGARRRAELFEKVFDTQFEDRLGRNAGRRSSFRPQSSDNGRSGREPGTSSDDRSPER